MFYGAEDSKPKKSSLALTFERVSKDIRMWATWKLTHKEFDQNGTVASTWDRMSKHDQEFNLAWNEIHSICHDLTLPKLKRVLAASKLIQRG